MSTRANIVVLTPTGVALSIYRHCDGFPEDVVPLIESLASSAAAAKEIGNHLPIQRFVDIFAPAEITQNRDTALWATGEADQFLRGECDMGFAISALQSANTPLANISNVRYLYVIDMYSEVPSLCVFEAPVHEAATRFGYGNGQYPAQMVANHALADIRNLPSYAKIRSAMWRVNELHALQHVIERCQREVCLCGDLPGMINAAQKAALMSAGYGFEVFLTMEAGHKVVWVGDADDKNHAEGLAVAYYANRNGMGQVYSVDEINSEPAKFQPTSSEYSPA